MLTLGDGQMGIPAFLVKLWRLVEDPQTNELISWRPDGLSFVINNQSRFSSELLPLNYKHNNMASFIRQLNMYGFHKVTSIENGGLRFSKDEMEFSHPDFRRGEYILLNNIKRKIAAAKGTSNVVDAKKGATGDPLNRVLTEVKAIRGKQDSLDSRFSTMKQENEALWRELVVLRQKHSKQQQIVNKLIQFLVTIVQPSRSGLKNMNGVKRHYQLMISDEPQSSKEETIKSKGPVIQEYYDEDSIDNFLAVDNDDDDDVVEAPEEIDEDEDFVPEAIVPEEFAEVSRVIEEKINQGAAAPASSSSQKRELALQPVAKKPKLTITPKLPDLSTSVVDLDLNLLNTPIVESPKNDRPQRWYGKQEDLFTTDTIPDDLLDNPFADQAEPAVPTTSAADWSSTSGTSGGNNLQLAKFSNNKGPSEEIFSLNTPEQFGSHLENVQQDLDSLQDMLNCEGYSLDVNPLDGLFGDSSDILNYPVNVDISGALDGSTADGNPSSSDLLDGIFPDID
ncbi:heat shock factor protein [Sergentomyia squamirostris]